MYLPPAKTSPPLPATGVVVRGCYAGALGDCGGDISKEHWISESVLLHVSTGGKTFMTNAPGLPPEGKWIPARTFAAKVLCERHNASLSGLDAAGRDFMQTLKEIDHAAAGAIPAAQPVYIFSGHDIERWLLKALCGGLAAGAFQTRAAERLQGDVPREWLELLFSRPHFPSGWGLYFTSEVGTRFDADERLGVAAITVEGRVIGISATMRGIEFVLVVRDVPAPNKRAGALTASSLYRPEAFRVGYGSTEKRGESVVRFCWDVRPQNAGQRPALC